MRAHCPEPHWICPAAAACLQSRRDKRGDQGRAKLGRKKRDDDDDDDDDEA